MPRPSAQRAFTLLELLLVLVLAAAGYAMLARVGAGGASSGELKSAARAVAAGLREARGAAIASQEPRALTLDLEKRSMEVSDGSRPRQLPARLELKLYTAQAEIVDDKRGAIRFYPDGSSTGGRVTLASGERALRVDVDWLTGRVSIKEGG